MPAGDLTEVIRHERSCSKQYLDDIIVIWLTAKNQLITIAAFTDKFTEWLAVRISDAFVSQ